MIMSGKYGKEKNNKTHAHREQGGLIPAIRLQNLGVYTDRQHSDSKVILLFFKIRKVG
jgi:hypothetical protein